MIGYATDIECLSRLAGLERLTGTVGVVGATGMVGHPLIRALAGVPNRSFELWAIARRPAPLPAGVRSLWGNVQDRALLAQVPTLDWVFDLAGPTSNYLARVRDTVESGTISVLALLEAGHGRKGFVYASSTRVYGRYPGDQPLNEDQASWLPAMHLDNLYDCSKRLAESLCLHFSHQGTRAMAARLTNLYGPHLAAGSTTALHDWIREGVTQGRITLQGDAEAVRNHCFVLDAVQGLLCIALHGQAGNAYNIGSDEHLSNRAVAELIGAQLPVRPNISTSPTAEITSKTLISIEKARRELGYAPQYRLANVLPHFIAHEIQTPCMTSPD